MFENLEQMTLYKRVETTTSSGTWDNGIYVPSTDKTITYEEFTGEWHSYVRGITDKMLPEGVSSTELITVITDTELYTDNDLYDYTKKADYIYLLDPTENPNTPAYKCYYKQIYLADPGFKNLTSDYYVITCIRQSKNSI